MENKEIITLKNGHKLAVKAIQIKETYDGYFFVGTPKLEDNIRVLEGLDSPSDWIIAKSVFNKSDFDLKKKVFEPYTVWIWFESDKSVNDPEGKFDFSELAVGFTANSIFEFSIQKFVESHLDDFPWEENAVNTIF